MGHTYYAVYVHIAFGTKERVPCLAESFRPELFKYLAGTLNLQKCAALAVGGYLDHVHLLVKTNSMTLTSELVKEVKRSSSIWLNQSAKVAGRFAWQEGYGAFSVGFSNIERVKRYIMNQAQHHQRMSWEDELRSFLKQHEIDYDERYIMG